MNSYPLDMDKECIPLCDFFNSIGLTTEYSCSGHGKTNFEIIFADCVKTEDIVSFLKIISVNKTHTPLIGSFQMWTRKCDDKIVFNWIYSVESIEWADKDLERMEFLYRNSVPSIVIDFNNNTK